MEFIEGTAHKRERLRIRLSKKLDEDKQFRTTLVGAHQNGIGVVIVDLGEDGAVATWAAYDPGPSSLYVLADAFADDDEIIDFVGYSVSHRAP